MTDLALSPVARRRRAVMALRHIIETTDRGTLSALRRADPLDPPAAFYRVTVAALDDCLPAGGRERDSAEALWSVVLAAMAAATTPAPGGAKVLLSDVPLGKALASATVAEARVVRLLEAGVGQLPDLVRHAVHQVLQKGQSFNPNDLADLVLTAGTPHAAIARARIARDYYRNIDDGSPQ